MVAKNPFEDGESIRRTQAEFRLQLAVIKHLESAFPQVMFTAFPGRPGDAQDGWFKKIMGTKAGVADLLLWFRHPQYPKERPCSAAIELKAPGGVWASKQNLWGSAFNSIGGKYAVCRSVKQVHDALVKWGINPLHESVTEPDCRSDTEKMRDSFNFFAP